MALIVIAAFLALGCANWFIESLARSSSLVLVIAAFVMLCGIGSFIWLYMVEES